jgi:hypothetical protein
MLVAADFRRQMKCSYPGCIPEGKTAAVATAGAGANWRTDMMPWRANVCGEEGTRCDAG